MIKIIMYVVSLSALPVYDLILSCWTDPVFNPTHFRTQVDAHLRQTNSGANNASSAVITKDTRILNSRSNDLQWGDSRLDWVLLTGVTNVRSWL